MGICRASADSRAVEVAVGALHQGRLGAQTIGPCTSRAVEGKFQERGQDTSFGHFVNCPIPGRSQRAATCGGAIKVAIATLDRRRIRIGSVITGEVDQVGKHASRRDSKNGAKVGVVVRSGAAGRGGSVKITVAGQEETVCRVTPVELGEVMQNGHGRRLRTRRPREGGYDCCQQKKRGDEDTVVA